MGKYMRKAKITGEVAVMEVSQASFGVRTRARTLALQRLQKTMPTSSTSNSGSSYLQLRSRRLEKPPLLVAGGNDSKKQQSASKESCKGNPSQNHNGRTISRLGSVNSGSIGSVSLSCSKKDEGLSAEEVTKLEYEEDEGAPENNNDVGIEASFGENVLEIEGRERETTPCSLIRDSDTIGTPGSTTRPINSTVTNRRSQNAAERNIPTTIEMEEFFAGAEQLQQRLFTEKYNFDPVNDMPLPGRYEWVKVEP
uniref:Cyclin-dependent kinase inhibitor domain-containing protein n=1 Tax=Nelumbo nucifera TaxID=4432 RepID=A0A822Z663_NELNU|nr:TPA_asm: hypothetical protein HUJ06_007659 [Nelumbo nucifera]